MKKDYIRPEMRVFTISADERIAANCVSTVNQEFDYCQDANHSDTPGGCWVYDSVNS